LKVGAEMLFSPPQLPEAGCHNLPRERQHKSAEAELRKLKLRQTREVLDEVAIDMRAALTWPEGHTRKAKVADPLLAAASAAMPSSFKY
jgi:hypothetical protein